MIATCFPAGTQWAWEVLAVDGSVVASGRAPTASRGRRASTRAWLAAQEDRPGGIDLAATGEVHFGGTHAAASKSSHAGRRQGERPTVNAA
jgi:hypothetical protein